MKKIFFLLMAGVLLSCFGESSQTLTSLPKPGSSGTAATPGTDVAAKIELKVEVPKLIWGGRSRITATVTTASGTPVPTGTKVSFAVNDTSLGTITPLATTRGGTSTALFTAGSIAVGSTTITATSGSASQATSIVVERPETGSIEFVSAFPKSIGIRGSGQPETSRITFSVKDIQGNPVEDGTSVDFTMSGPNGGEYIGTTTAKAQSATQNGLATVTLNSGSVAGPVNIIATATVNQKTFSTSAPSVSIGGGAPSATHFDLATTKLNLPGLVWVNSTADILAFVADRFGNFDVLQGTSISFYTEAGAISKSGTTDAQGFAKATLRTQEPHPATVNTSGKYHPENGHLKVLAVTVGEEAFDDLNGNGKFDVDPVTKVATEPLTVDIPEPFIDKDDNRRHDDDEFFIDANGDGLYNEANGLWDGPGCSQTGCLSTKMIWTTITLAFTGHPECTLVTNATSFLIPGDPNSPFIINNSQTITVTFIVGDKNNNIPPSGTTVTVDATAGKISGTASFTLQDIVGNEKDSNGNVVVPFTKHVSLADDDPTPKAFPGDPVTVTLTVKPPPEVNECITSLSGFIQ